MKSKKVSKKNKGTALFLAVLFGVILAFTGFIVYYQVSRAPKTQATTTARSVSVLSGESTTQPPQKVDASAYYAENAQELIAVTPAEESSRVYSEKAVSEALGARGFGEDPAATYAYEIDGSREEESTIDADGVQTHPQYTLLYTAKNGDYWTITVCNDCVTAYPITYNLEHNDGAELIFSERESITAYDSATNSFYEMIPKPSALLVKHIPAITAEVIEQLTAEEIEKL